MLWCTYYKVTKHKFWEFWRIFTSPKQVTTTMQMWWHSDNLRVHASIIYVCYYQYCCQAFLWQFIEFCCNPLGEWPKHEITIVGSRIHGCLSSYRLSTTMRKYKIWEKRWPSNQHYRKKVLIIDLSHMRVKILFMYGWGWVDIGLRILWKSCRLAMSYMHKIWICPHHLSIYAFLSFLFTC